MVRSGRRERQRLARGRDASHLQRALACLDALALGGADDDSGAKCRRDRGSVAEAWTQTESAVTLRDEQPDGVRVAVSAPPSERQRPPCNAACTMYGQGRCGGRCTFPAGHYDGLDDDGVAEHSCDRCWYGDRPRGQQDPAAATASPSDGAITPTASCDVPARIRSSTSGEGLDVTHPPAALDERPDAVGVEAGELADGEFPSAALGESSSPCPADPREVVDMGPFWRSAACAAWASDQDDATDMASLGPLGQAESGAEEVGTPDPAVAAPVAASQALDRTPAQHLPDEEADETASDLAAQAELPLAPTTGITQIGGAGCPPPEHKRLRRCRLCSRDLGKAAFSKTQWARTLGQGDPSCISCLKNGGRDSGQTCTSDSSVHDHTPGTGEHLPRSETSARGTEPDVGAANEFAVASHDRFSCSLCSTEPPPRKRRAGAKLAEQRPGWLADHIEGQVESFLQDSDARVRDGVNVDLMVGSLAAFDDARLGNHQLNFLVNRALALCRRNFPGDFMDRLAEGGEARDLYLADEAQALGFAGYALVVCIDLTLRDTGVMIALHTDQVACEPSHTFESVAADLVQVIFDEAAAEGTPTSAFVVKSAVPLFAKWDSARLSRLLIVLVNSPLTQP